MVNYKKKTAKKGRTTSNPTQTEKRTTVPSTLASPVSDHEQVPVVTSLPPAVDGHLRCFLRVCVPTIHWTVHKYPSDVQVRLKWWGEEGEGVLFRPIDDKAADQRRDSAPLTCVRYAVCSGPRQFNAYLKDMGPLIFDVVHGPSLVGQVRLADATQLSASDPIQGFFDVMSTTSPSEKLALLYITVRFESISAAYNQLSSSIPTVDTEMDSQRRRASDESDVQPTPPPLSLNPATPITHPRHASQDTDPFVSPAPQIKGVKFSSDSPERLEYTAEHTLIPAPATEETEIDTREKDDTGSMPKSELLSASSLLQTHRGAGVSSDLIGALLQRGEKLREAMVMSADEDNDLDETGGLGSVVERNTPPGKLFKAILTSHDTDGRPAVPGEDESSLIESVFLHNNKAVDLVLGEENMHYMMQSPESSPESSIVSELGDPLHDESLLTDLFYTTPAMQSDADSDHTVSTDDNDDDEQTITHACTSQGKKISRKAKQKHHSPQTIHSKDPVKMNRVSSSVGYIDPKQSSTDDTTDADHRGQHSPNKTSADSFPSTRNSRESSPNPLEFIENLGPEKLTALGRVDAARVMVDSLGINVENIKPGTYFVEYSFPTSTPAQTQEEDISMATELTRIASKKLQDGVVLFNHRSMFPALFNSTVIDYWWRRPLTFRLYFRESGQRVPAVVGIATFPLKTVLQSDTLTSSASLQIKHSKHDESSSSSSVHHLSASDDRQCASGSYGPLLVKVELMTDGKQLHVKSSRHRKPPLPTTPTKTTDRVQVAKPAQLVGQVFSGASHGTTSAVSLSDKLPSRITHKFDVTSGHDHDRDPFTLYMLLWIPDGKDLIQHGYCGNKGLVTKNNLYLVCRMFWCDEVSKSKVCWGSTDPPFGFKQVAPVLLTSSLLQRVCNNFMVIEVWNRVGSHDHGEQLVGLVKLPLHQLYLSYRDPKITKTLLKSKYPVVAVDEWCTVTNPFTHIQHGHLRVLLAMGLEEQIAAILTMKCGGDVSVGMESRPDHHLDTHSVRNKEHSENVHLTRNQEFVEHQFEITVEDIRGLSVFRSTVWGETDCFVQYHFPYQRHLQSSDSTSEAIPNLQPYRTPTTLCVPDPAFHDVARHAFKLPQGFPVQKHLLAAFTGSWVAAPSVPWSGGVPFELWRRYYYPNIRDQMVAKASLPLAKLCAMVTMQKQGEANIQTFSLPLTVLAGDEIHSMRQDRVHDTGLLDVTVKYQQVRPTQLAGGCTAQKEEDNHVCLSLEVIQACGLKAAASLHAKSNPSLSYPAEVGVNTYIVIQFPLGRKRKHVTRTVARTFSPEFSHNADILLPVVVPSDVGQKRNLSLAEQLEDSEMLFEVWHQMSRGMSSNLVITSDSQARAAREKDVLLGVGRVPLIKLLTHKTGVKGWYPIYLPSESNIRDASSCGDTEKVTGGLELCISFSEAEDRDHIIHLSRGVGWSLPPGMECDDDWLDKEELSKERHWEFCLKINKAWIPPLELHSFNSAAKKADKSVKAYARYKLYNKAPICSRISPVKDSGDGKLVCELKHSKDIMLPVTPSLAWHMKEECLEIQLWLSNRRHNADSNSRKRDRLLGSAFVDVSSLLVSQQRKNRQISGLYPLFRSGASDLLGACIHVQVSLNWCSEGGSDPEPDLEQHVSSDDSVYVGSPVEDHDTHSSTMISSQEHSAKTTQHYAKRQLPITDSDSDDTFTAHVIIDQALHLPTVPGNNGERLMPSVYVSYQTLPSVPLSCTSVVVSSTHPSWEFQKLERISYTSLKSQGLVFKVCHTSGGTLDEGVHTQEPGSAERKQDSSNGDRVIGFVSFDLSPLLAGMRQLIGWYNVTDFNGDCKGQIKLGVSPVIPVSPPRSLPSSSNLHVPSKQDGALADSSFPVNHGEPCQMMRQDGSDLRSHTDDMSHHPKGLQEDDRIGFRSHARIGITLDTDGVAETPVCSTSLLFSQLRHNMKELDTLQQNLNLKLRSGNAWNDAVLGDSSVDNPPSSSFPDRGVIATSSKTLETLRAKNTGAQGPDLGSRLSRTEFGETDFRHEVVSLDGKKISVPDDGQLLSSPHHARDLESHDQIVERTSVAKKDEEMEATNGKDIFAFDKGEVEHLQKNAEVGSFLGLQGNMSSKGATNARDIFPFDKEEQKYLQPNTEVDSFFSLGTNRSSAEDRRPSVDSELSVSDISEDLSVSGYVQDNSRTARFTDIKDSWLSSEEEEGTTENVDQSDKPGSSSFPSAFNYAEIGALDNATESQFRCREIDIHSSDHDDGGSDDGNGDKVKVLDNAVAGSKAHEENSLEGISDKVNAGSEKEAGLVNDESDGKVKSFQTDQDNEYNSYASYNKTQSRELPRQAPLSGFHDSFQLTSTALPNFFMPTEQLAESMRALRLGTSLHKANSSYSKLLARSNHLKSDPQTKGKLSERFAKREPVYKARRDERPPISNAEADRIARIFNSGSV